MISGFVFTKYLYCERAILRRHSHELAYFSFVLTGSYTEHRSQKQVRHCVSENVLYHPAGEAHSDAFGNRGGTIFSIELEPRWVSTLREYELRAEESLALPERQISWLARRAYHAFSDSDHRYALLLEAATIELLYQLPWKHAAQAESDSPRDRKSVV